MIRSSVDLPQPEAPIRQTNSRLSIIGSTWCRASMRSEPLGFRTVNVLPTSRTCRNGRRSGTVLRAPGEDAVVEGDDQSIAEEAGDADHDHAGDDQVGPRQG